MHVVNIAGIVKLTSIVVAYSLRANRSSEH